MKILNKIKKSIFPKSLSENATTSFVLEKTGNQIYTGPFAGLAIPDILKPNLKLAEALGLYEYALHGCFSNLINKNIENIMVIGGHKGYYPAGLSNLLRPNNMYVFEMDLNFQPLIDSWIEVNNLKPYQTFGEASEEILLNWTERIDFLLIDCEGAEDFLLQPQKFNWQKETDILVEIHHFYNNKILGNLVTRFKDTHDLLIIYDDISENEKIHNVLEGLGIEGSFRGQPNHRWILDENNNKIITAGIFLYMSVKNT
ncbi:hypothetical protein K0U91_05030 [Chryseobacterium chendengshani]|uniref:hypothetical protein n=1 Tax=Chryseobacterium sp. LJ668 TaxID=2864040 RepID=UPI001C68FFF8|nr:hypothetical protein [Chryseobacterium sp. LJ668]MBW8521829.1 hypothetical protein [Chryseobacterium sp. LJ668]QYK17489.1 hypothetical protein K0U91_05030 [Chryseobacterium sp. LJ668]